MSRPTSVATSAAPTPLTKSGDEGQRVVIESRENTVDSVDFDPRNETGSDIGAGQGTDTRGTVGLCPPRATAVDPVDFPREDQSGSTQAAAVDSARSGDGVQDGAAEPEASADAGVVDELPEALRLLDLVGTDEDPYKAGGPWAYADEKETGNSSRCFFITTNVMHPSGRVLLSEDRIKKARDRRPNDRHAYVLHDKDVYSADDAETIPSAVEGEPKADGWHIAEGRKSAATIGQVARAYGVPPSCVEVKPLGAFLDLVEYLTHEHPNQQAKGKHRYADEEVHANFDWRPALEEHKLARSFSAGRRANAKKRDALRLAVMHGEKTLRQVRLEEPGLYAEDYDKLHKLRKDFLLHSPPPQVRINYYIDGPSGTGKTLLARTLARSLFPDLDPDECYFEAGSAKVAVQNYGGQPVVIWDDYRAGDLVAALGGRTSVWRTFDPHPGGGEVNIKNGSMRMVQSVNIVTGVTPYLEFLPALAGKYKAPDGTMHEAEDETQGFRRFQFVATVGEYRIEFLSNAGFFGESAEYDAFQHFLTMQASMRDIYRTLDSIETEEGREQARIALGDRMLSEVVHRHRRASAPQISRTAESALAELEASVQVYTDDDLAVARAAKETERKAREDAAAARRAAKQQADAQALAERREQCTCGPEMRWEPYLKEHHISVDCPLISDWDRECLEHAAQRQAEEVEKKVERLKRGEPIVDGRTAS